jgi:cyclomaltodextrinase / maltogenic alpha-amylase / neopullulanase
MTDVMKYWVREFGVDGFRCDVAYTVPIDFWEAARVELEQINPQVVILADAGAKPALLSKAFDMDCSWHLFSALSMVMNSVSPAYFLRQQFPNGALHLRFTDSHDRVRAVVRYGLEGALATQVLMLTLDGVPLFYNGMEVGDATESTDPALFEKLPIFWTPGGRPPLRDIYRDLIKLRKQYPAFRTEEVTWLQNSSPAEVVSFLREDGQDQFLVLINLSSRQVVGSVELPNAEDFAPVPITGRPQPLGATLPDFRLNGYGWFIYHRPVPK